MRGDSQANNAEPTSTAITLGTQTRTQAEVSWPNQVRSHQAKRRRLQKSAWSGSFYGLKFANCQEEPDVFGAAFLIQTFRCPWKECKRRLRFAILIFFQNVFCQNAKALVPFGICSQVDASASFSPSFARYARFRTRKLGILPGLQNYKISKVFRSWLLRRT